MSALRTLVIGAGRRGEEWVAQLEAHAGFEVAGVVDPALAIDVPDRARAFRTSDVVAAVTEVAPDCAIVATPPDAHVAPTDLLLAQRVPVLVEKPLATTFADARRMVDAAAAADVPLLVAMNHRYLRSHRTVRSVLDSGLIGPVHTFSARYYRTPHDMAPSLAALDDQVLWGMAVHHFDAIRYVLRREVTGVVGQQWTAPSTAGPRGASLHALLELEGGVHASYSATYESSGRRTFEGGQEFYERVIGERGTLHVLQRWLVVWGATRIPRVVRRGARSVTEEHVLLDQLHRSIVDRVTPECSGADHLRTLAVTEAFLRSIDEARWIDPREVLSDV